VFWGREARRRAGNSRLLGMHVLVDLVWGSGRSVRDTEGRRSSTELRALRRCVCHIVAIDGGCVRAHLA
jgi:hypothetical protein